MAEAFNEKTEKVPSPSLSNKSLNYYFDIYSDNFAKLTELLQSCLEKILFFGDISPSL